MEFQFLGTWIDNYYGKTKMKKCIFFALMGDYDVLKDPTYVTSGWDYICFTNNRKLKSKVWDIRFTENNKLNNSRFSRKIWVLYHRYVNEYDISISTGAQMQPTCNLDIFLNTFLPSDKEIDMSIAIHPSRNCIYEEAKRCYKRDDPKIIKKQMDFYRSEGHPKNNGLIATGIIIRKHHRQNVEKHCEKWWEQLRVWSFRDQLSFNYILWKYNLLNINYFSYDVIRGKGNYFKKYRHEHGGGKRYRGNIL